LCAAGGDRCAWWLRCAYAGSSTVACSAGGVGSTERNAISSKYGVPLVEVVAVGGSEMLVLVILLMLVVLVLVHVFLHTMG
jgi:hypothetical protein